jgi:hypothetical protein
MQNICCCLPTSLYSNICAYPFKSVLRDLSLKRIHSIMEFGFVGSATLGVVCDALTLDYLGKELVGAIGFGFARGPAAFQVEDGQLGHLDSLSDFLVVGHFFGFLEDLDTLPDEIIGEEFVVG